MCKEFFLELTKALRHDNEIKIIFEAWCVCGSNMEWHTSWPKLNLMQLMQKVIHSLH